MRQINRNVIWTLKYVSKVWLVTYLSIVIFVSFPRDSKSYRTMARTKESASSKIGIKKKPVDSPKKIAPRNVVGQKKTVATNSAPKQTPRDHLSVKASLVSYFLWPYRYKLSEIIYSFFLGQKSPPSAAKRAMRLREVDSFDSVGRSSNRSNSAIANREVVSRSESNSIAPHCKLFNYVDPILAHQFPQYETMFLLKACKYMRMSRIVHRNIQLAKLN